MRRRFLSPIQSSAWAQTMKSPTTRRMEQLVVSRTWHGSACSLSADAPRKTGRLFGRSAPWRKSYSVWNHQVATHPSALLQYQAARFAGLLLFAWMVVRHCTPWQPRVFSWKTHSREQTNHLVRSIRHVMNCTASRSKTNYLSSFLIPSP